MYICLCQGITDHQIRQAVEDGATSMTEVRQQLNIANQCGKCAVEAKRIIKNTMKASSPCHLPPLFTDATVGLAASS